MTEYVVIVEGRQPNSVYLEFPHGRVETTKYESSFGAIKAFQQNFATGIFLIVDEDEYICKINVSDEPGYLQYTLTIEDNRCMVIEERTGVDAF
ncbi:MAG: hypothetical protein ABJD75_08220 [Parasphingorhabdus sp.]|uniref:hypothetical protein n=1 Tax=Parasphingorhabdus sp. TaxID=2709688 RepID=UPI003264297D